MKTFMTAAGWLALILFLIFVCLAQYGILVAISAHDVNTAIPYLMGEGFTYFDDIISFHPPLLSTFLTFAYAINPDPLTNLRLLNVAYVLGTGALIFAIGRRGWGKAVGVAGAIFYLLWATTYNGLFFYLDGLIGTCSAVILLLATFKPRARNLILMGIMGGIAATLKQNALPVVLAAALWMMVINRRDIRAGIRNSLLILVSGLLVYGGQYALIAASGLWDEALFVLFNPGSANWLRDLSGLLDGPALRSVSLTLVFLPAYVLLWLRDRERFSLGLLVWLLCGATAILNIPTLGYYHMMGALPTVAVMSGVVIGAGWEVLRETGRGGRIWEHLSIAQLALVGMIAGIALATAFTALTPVFALASGGVSVLGWDELRPVSAWLDANTAEDETVLVLPAYDTSPNVYPQAKRKPPFYMKIWWYHAIVPANAALFEERFLAAPPDVIVLFPTLYAEVTTYLPNVNDYMDDHYEQVEQITGIPFQGDAVILRLDVEGG